MNFNNNNTAYIIKKTFHFRVCSIIIYISIITRARYGSFSRFFSQYIVKCSSLFVY